MQPVKIATHVHQISLGVVNAYAVTNLEDDWVLIDTGMKFHFGTMKSLETHFGRPPVGILLTHGHPDHVGSASELARAWNVKIYTHMLERPFLVGKAQYPPYDPTVGGVLAQVSRAMPVSMFNLTGQLEIYPEGGSVPFLPDWKVIETPGHSPGHVSFWHEPDRVLIAGDALCTADMDTIIGMTTQKKEFARGGSPFTFDWEKSRHSVGLLADLEPVTVAAGHGQPISGADTPQQLRDFAHNFTPPAQGRYVARPAESDENGVTYLPPKPEDDFGRNVAAVVGAATLLTVGAKLLGRKSGDMKSQPEKRVNLR